MSERYKESVDYTQVIMVVKRRAKYATDRDDEAFIRISTEDFIKLYDAHKEGLEAVQNLDMSSEQEGSSKKDT